MERAQDGCICQCHLKKQKAGKKVQVEEEYEYDSESDNGSYCSEISVDHTKKKKPKQRSVLNDPELEAEYLETSKHIKNVGVDRPDQGKLGQLYKDCKDIRFDLSRNKTLKKNGFVEDPNNPIIKELNVGMKKYKQSLTRMHFDLLPDWTIY